MRSCRIVIVVIFSSLSFMVLGHDHDHGVWQGASDVMARAISHADAIQDVVDHVSGDHLHCHDHSLAPGAAAYVSPGRNRCVAESTDNFCQSPYDAVCGNNATNTSRIGRDERMRELRNEIEQKALRRVEKELGLDSKSLKSRADISSIGRGFGRTFSVISASLIYYSALNDLGTRSAQSTELRRLIPTTNEIRTMLKGQLSQMTSNKLFQRLLGIAIDSVEIVTTFDMKFMLGIPEATRRVLLRSFNAVCGSDGLSNNAFAQTINNKKYIFICPGWIIRGVSKGAEVASLRRNLLMVVAHEFGHHIDANKLSSFYDKYIACLEVHHAERCPDRDPCRDSSCMLLKDSDRAIYGRPDAEYRSRVISTHKGEITADYWAVQTLSNELANADSSARLGILRESYGGLCQRGGDEGIHPSGPYRIEVILRRDPRIHNLMGCTSPSTGGKPGCTLGGATSNNLL